jgi:predicted phage baseplate assembly protein
MGQHWENLKKALDNSAKFAGAAILNLLQTPNVIREGVGGVLLAGVSTNAVALSAARVQFAIQVARRLPFASPQSICNAARDAAVEADTYAPYVVTLEALFGNPAALFADVVFAGYGAAPGAVTAGAAIAKATAILALLADLPKVDSIDDLPKIFETHLDDVVERGERLYEDVGKLLDPSDFLRGKSLDQAVRAKLEAVKQAFDTFATDGHNTPLFDGILAGVPKVFNAAVRGTTRVTDAVYAQYDALCGAGLEPARGFYERREYTISLDRTYPSIPAGDGSWALLTSRTDTDLFAVAATEEQSRSEFGLSGKTTELTLDFAKRVALNTVFKNKVRELSVFAESEEVGIAEKPLDTLVEGNTILLEQLTGGLLPNHPIAVSGRDAHTGEKIAEIAFVESFRSNGAQDEHRTRITLKALLAHRYLRHTVQVNANVAPASNGESIREVLGSGDASARHQEFALKQAPLTHVAADTASGRISTLAVFVNDMRWAEVPTLVGREPHERVFATEADDEGRTRIRFGDGTEGAVAASGFNNVRAAYRKGIGEPGNVEAGTLTTLLTRPAGVTSVVNPIAASGGEDIEPIDDSRRNAPITVRTFDRAVSLTDYEDFALTFAGIAKALATWTTSGGGRGILVTVAGLHGAPIDDASDTHRKLFVALRKFGDPLIPLEIKTYRPATFHVKATVTVAADATAEIVMAQVTAALRRDFGFDARPFADAISIDDVMASIHTVVGVVGVDVDAFYRHGQAAQLNATLVALPPQVQSNGNVTPAELLSLDEAPIELTSVQLEGAA